MFGQRFHALIPAAGIGRRMGGEQPKQYLRAAGKTLIEHVLDLFALSPALSTVTVCLAAEDTFGRRIVEHYHEGHADKEFLVAPGGAERCHSVQNGLAVIAEVGHERDWVLVHDAARPCLTEGDLAHLVDVLHEEPVGGILATPVRDTLKRAAAGAPPSIAETVPREGLWQALTPQMFRHGILSEALAAVVSGGGVVTDEAQAVERLGLVPRLVAGRTDNIKVTLPEDLRLAEQLLTARRQGEPA